MLHNQENRRPASPFILALVSLCPLRKANVKLGLVSRPLKAGRWHVEERMFSPVQSISLGHVIQNPFHLDKSSGQGGRWQPVAVRHRCPWMWQWLTCIKAHMLCNEEVSFWQPYPVGTPILLIECRDVPKLLKGCTVYRRQSWVSDPGCLFPESTPISIHCLLECGENSGLPSQEKTHTHTHTHTRACTPSFRAPKALPWGPALSKLSYLPWIR